GGENAYRYASANLARCRREARRADGGLHGGCLRRAGDVLSEPAGPLLRRNTWVPFVDTPRLRVGQHPQISIDKEITTQIVHVVMNSFSRSLPMMLYRTLDAVMPEFRAIFA